MASARRCREEVQGTNHRSGQPGFALLDDLLHTLDRLPRELAEVEVGSDVQDQQNSEQRRDPACRRAQPTNMVNSSVTGPTEEIAGGALP